MKVVRNIIVLMIIIFFQQVNASVNLNCASEIVNSGDDVHCSIEVDSDKEINSLFFHYDGNISFEDNSLYIISDNNHDVNIKFNNLTLTNIIPFSIKNITEDLLITLSNFKINDEIVEGNISKQVKVKSEELSNDCFLTSITVDGKNISDFSKEQLSYKNIVVHKPIVFIDAKRSSEKSMASGLGSVLLRENITKDVNITVKAQNGDVKVYTLSITYIKEVIKNGDNSLSLIELYNTDEKKLDFQFDKNKNEYNYTLKEDLDKIYVKAVINDARSKFVDGYEPKSVKLNYGTNKIEIKVIAENGDTRDYIINVTRNDNRSDDATLKTLIINDEKIKLTNNKFDYTVTLRNLKESSVALETNNKKAKVEYQNIKYLIGENILKIKVISEKGTEKEYKIKITMEEDKVLPDENSGIPINIIINNADFIFDANKYEYNLTLDEEVDELDIKIESSDEVEKKIIGNEHLVDGSVIEIELSNKEVVSTYKITIHKEIEVKENNEVILSKDKENPSSENGSSLELICYGVFGLGVIVLIASILYSIKIRKN